MTASRPESAEQRLEQLTEQVQLLRQEALNFEQACLADTEGSAPGCRALARNLIHCLAARRHDLRRCNGAWRTWG